MYEIDYYFLFKIYDLKDFTIYHELIINFTQDYDYIDLFKDPIDTVDIGNYRIFF